MDQIRQRMLLSEKQRHAVIHLDDHGVRDPAPLFVMDFETWDLYRPENFFAYFALDGSVAAYARYKPVWQRFSLLHANEARVLQGIYDQLGTNHNHILQNETLSQRYHKAYATMSALVDELDSLVDRDLLTHGFWNHGYIINDRIDTSDD